MRLSTCDHVSEVCLLGCKEPFFFGDLNRHWPEALFHGETPDFFSIMLTYGQFVREKEDVFCGGGLFLACLIPNKNVPVGEEGNLKIVVPMGSRNPHAAR
jgi:hypothetical protein